MASELHARRSARARRAVHEQARALPTRPRRRATAPDMRRRSRPLPPRSSARPAGATRRLSRTVTSLRSHVVLHPEHAVTDTELGHRRPDRLDLAGELHPERRPLRAEDADPETPGSARRGARGSRSVDRRRAHAHEQLVVSRHRAGTSSMRSTSGGPNRSCTTALISALRSASGRRFRSSALSRHTSLPRRRPR